MNVISKLDVKEFRGIKECKTPLRFTDFSVIIGRNNSGKSAVLEALSLLPFMYCNAKHQHLGNITPLDFIRQIHNSPSYQHLVYRYEGKANIDADYKGISLSGRLHDAGLQVSKGDQVWGNPFTVQTDFASNNMEPPDINEVVFIPNNSLFLERVSASLGSPAFREAITKSGANTTIVSEFINPHVNDVFTEILWDGNIIKLRRQYSDGTLSYINVSDLGDGMKKVVIIAMLLEHLKPQVVLWDDFEGSVHPSLLKKVMQWLASKPWQVIMTTHSIDVLRTLVDLEPEGAEVIMTSKDSGDVLRHKTYPLDEFEELFYSNTDPRYIADSLGL